MDEVSCINASSFTARFVYCDVKFYILTEFSRSDFNSKYSSLLGLSKPPVNDTF